MKPNQLSNFSYNRKQFARFDFKNNQYWIEKFKNNSNIQFVCNVQKHNLSFYDLMKLAVNLERGNPRWSCDDYDKYVKSQFNSNQKHIYFHDYRIATLNQEIKSNQIQLQKKHNKLTNLPIPFDFFVQNNKLNQLLDSNESLIELTFVKNNKGQFVAFGFLYLFIKRNHMTDYNIFLPITISNSGIELGYLMSLCSHDYNIAIKNHYEKMMNLAYPLDPKVDSTLTGCVISANHPMDHFKPSSHSIYQNWIDIINWSNACVKQKELDKLYESKYNDEFLKLRHQENYVELTIKIVLQEQDYANYYKSNPNDKHELFKLKSNLDWLYNDLCFLEDQCRGNFKKENQHLLSTYKATPSDNQPEIVARMCF